MATRFDLVENKRAIIDRRRVAGAFGACDRKQACETLAEALRKGREEIARRIAAAKRPAIVTGDEIVKSDALEEAAALAVALGCPAWQQTSAYGAHFLSECPCFMGALPRNQAQVRDLLAPHDLLLVLGACAKLLFDLSTRPHELYVLGSGA